MEDKLKKKQKRLNIEIDETLHSKLKVYSAKRNITLRKVVVRALLQYVKEESKHE